MQENMDQRKPLLSYILRSELFAFLKRILRAEQVKSLRSEN